MIYLFSSKIELQINIINGYILYIKALMDLLKKRWNNISKVILVKLIYFQTIRMDFYINLIKIKKNGSILQTLVLILEMQLNFIKTF